MWSQLAYRCRQWHVHFPPQQRTSDHLRLFSPSVDLKALTRMCLKWRVVLSAPSGMQASLSFFIWALSLSSSLTSFTLHWIPLSLPFSISLSQSTEVNSVCLRQVWECRFAALMGLKQSRACYAVITFRRVCACVELNQSSLSDLAPLCHQSLTYSISAARIRSCLFYFKNILQLRNRPGTCPHSDNNNNLYITTCFNIWMVASNYKKLYCSYYNQ